MTHSTSDKLSRETKLASSIHPTRSHNTEFDTQAYAILALVGAEKHLKAYATGEAADAGMELITLISLAKAQGVMTLPAPVGYTSERGSGAEFTASSSRLELFVTTDLSKNGDSSVALSVGYPTPVTAFGLTQRTFGVTLYFSARDKSANLLVEIPPQGKKDAALAFRFSTEKPHRKISWAEEASDPVTPLPTLRAA